MSKTKDVRAKASLLRWNRLSLRSRISITVLCAVIPFMAVVGLSYLATDNAISQDFSIFITDDTLKRSRIVTMELESFSNMLFQLVTDDVVIDQMNVVNSSKDPIMRRYYSNTINKLIKRYKYMRNGLAQTVIISAKDTYVSYDTSPTFQTTVFDTLHSYFWDSFDSLSDSVYYKTFSNYYQNSHIMGPVMMDGKEASRYVYFMGEKICNLTSLATEGVAIFAILEDHLDEICNIYGNEALSYSFLVDSSGKFLTNSDDSLIGASAIDAYGLNRNAANRILGSTLNDIYVDTVSKDGNRQLLSAVPVENSDWYLISIFNYTHLNGTMTVFRRGIILSLSVILVIALAIIRFFTNSITSDVSRLSEQILHNSWDAKISESDFTNNELEIIVTSYHTLLGKFQAAMEASQKSAAREKRMALSTLESQINSHFLYNTLDNINWKVMEKGDYEVSEMITRLAQILRYTITGSAYVVAFSQELHWTQSYLYIQSKRFGGSFTYSLTADPASMDFPVHKLLLQPFIENAIMHGLCDTQQGGVISLNACIDPKSDKLRVVLTDNGRGMSEETVSRYFVRREVCREGHVGIANVLERLELYYVDGYSIDVESSPSKGTSITLTFPRAHGARDD